MSVTALAAAAAERGFEGLFLPEHTHIPVSRDTPFPGGVPMPERYKSLWDPYIALSFVAARTELWIGTCVSLVGQHDAIALAKAIATLDQLSGGRFLLGVGYGWNREEFEDHGYPREDLLRVVREKVELMQQVWTEEVASYEGENVRLSPSWSWPKPAQAPHPPVLLGAPLKGALLGELLRWADGWIPMGMPTVEALGRDLERLRRHWQDAGRDPGALRLAVMQWPDPKHLARDLERLAELGVGWVLVDLPTAPAEELLPLLDTLAPVAAHPSGR